MDSTMTSARPTSINDDHGDQFPGALLRATGRPARDGADARLVRMHAAYAHKVNSLVEAGRDDLAHDLAEAFAEESSATPAGGSPDRRAAGRRTPSRGRSGRRPGQADTPLGGMGRFTRRSLDRFDRYTLDVFNPGAPYRPNTDR